MKTTSCGILEDVIRTLGKRKRQDTDRKIFNYIQWKVKSEVRQWLHTSWYDKISSVSTADGSPWKLYPDRPNQR